VLTAWEADYPQDAGPHVMRGKLASTNLNWAAAAGHYESALKLDPGNTAAMLGLATAQINTGHVETAATRLKTLVALEPDNRPARLALAQCHIKLDELKPARKELEAIIAAEPENVEALLEAGNLELASNNPQQAAIYLRKALKLRPESREVAYAAARTLQTAGDKEEAARLFKFVDEGTKPLIRLKKLTGKLLHEPGDIQTRFEIAAITWKYKSHEEGANWLKSLLKYDPLHPPTHMALLKHYEITGNEKQAAYHRQYVEAAKAAAAKQNARSRTPPTAPLGPVPAGAKQAGPKQAGPKQAGPAQENPTGDRP